MTLYSLLPLLLYQQAFLGTAEVIKCQGTEVTANATLVSQICFQDSNADIKGKSPFLYKWMVKLPCTSRSAAQEIHQQLQNLSAPGKRYYLSLKPGSACWTELYNNGKIKHFLEEKSQTWNSQESAQGAHLTYLASPGQEQPHKWFLSLCCQQSRNKLERERHGILGRCSSFSNLLLQFWVQWQL